MWSKSKNQAVKELAPILAEESKKTTNVEWLRYTITLEQLPTSIIGFELTGELATELKYKLSLSPETFKQLWCNSVCSIGAMDVTTGNCYNVTLIKKSDDNFILDWTNCCGCNAGKTIDFDINNTFWSDDWYSRYEGVFFAIKD